MVAQPARPLYRSLPARDELTSLFYWRSLWRRRRWLVGLTLLGTALGLGGAALRAPNYCARAVLRPISTPDVMSQFADAGGLLGIPLGGRNETDAYHYISIIKSREFLFRLLGEHRLSESTDLASGGWLGPGRPGPWETYRAVTRAMEVEFDRRQGNIVVELTLKDRRLAQNLLVWTIDDLRRQLRKSVLDECEASNHSLEEQIKRTPDDIVRGQLYQQIGRGLQRAALAKIQADFAFSVIDPPLADDRPTNLAPLEVGALSALAILLLGTLGIWSYDYLDLLRVEERGNTARRGWAIQGPDVQKPGSAI
jgi:hypothetical protein